MMAFARLQIAAGGDWVPPAFNIRRGSQATADGFESNEAHHGQAS